MRGLLILPPYIGQILDGHKTWEMRKSRCSIRERIALIQSKTQTVVGVADIIDCIGPLTDQERFDAETCHGVAASKWLNPKFANYRFAWVLANVTRLSKPVPYLHPPGAVIWVTLNQRVESDISAHLARSK
jgi:hypothetical protein